MSRQFTTVSPQYPCPICGKPDWCEIGDRAVHCMRVESNRPAAKEGWYHFFEDRKCNPVVTFRPPARKIVPSSFDAESFMASVKGVGDIKSLSIALGVSAGSLNALAAGYSTRHKAWAFPMKDGDGKIIGIRLRNSEGKKWAVPGSRQGIFIPDLEPQKICFLPEGPTDTAALLSMGLFAIGRPTCMSGNDMIKIALKRLGIYRVVIVADNDGLKSVGNQQRRPGLVGALKLKKELGLLSVIWMPPSPIKDAREFLRKGGTKEMIENEIKNKIWNRR